jgi:serine/threonine protein kinase
VHKILQVLVFVYYTNFESMLSRFVCHTVFVNGHVGEVKIGDLGLSAVIAAEKAESVIGTPEYMAPELYEESYTEKVDIYAFGMCLLEMVSMDYPYSECKGPAQIMKKAINSEKPAAFFKLVDSDVKDVVAQCLKREPERPSAEELQRHPLFRDWNSDDGTRSNLSLVIGTAESAKENPSLELAASGDLAVGEKVIAFSEKLNRDVYVAMEGHSNLADVGSSEPGVVVEQASEGPAFRIGITIPIQDLGVKLIEFTISPNDEPRVVAGEMVTEFGLDPQMVPELTDEIEKQLSSLRELRERDQHVLFRSPGPTASFVTTSHANRAVER